MTISGRSFDEARALLDEWNRRASTARPFLKWAGGKRLFLTKPESQRLIPVPKGRYIEPFLGSASVFFYVCRAAGRPVPAQLGDANSALIECYWQVQENPEQVWCGLNPLIAGFKSSADKRGFYEKIRENFNRRLPRVDAADFIFLNRTCWNGLYRVNQKGEFNVPMGKIAEERTMAFPTEENLLDAAVALSTARLRATSWEHTLSLAEEGDFVFLDPPYYSDWLRDDSKYSAKLFSPEDHARLADEAVRLANRGISFVLTNSGEKAMVELYRSRGLQARIVSIPRAINSNTAARSGVRELVVTP